MKNMLVPVDGSENCAQAIKMAVELAPCCGAKITYIHVANLNQLAINTCFSEAVLEAINKTGEAILEQAVAQTPVGIETEAVNSTGSPAVAIVDYAKEHAVDMIVMGSRGLGVVKGMLLGSVSQYVLENSKCPVLVVK